MYGCGGRDGCYDGDIFKEEVGIGWLLKIAHSALTLPPPPPLGKSKQKQIFFRWLPIGLWGWYYTTPQCDVCLMVSLIQALYHNLVCGSAILDMIAVLALGHIWEIIWNHLTPTGGLGCSGALSGPTRASPPLSTYLLSPPTTSTTLSSPGRLMPGSRY